MNIVRYVLAAMILAATPTAHAFPRDAAVPGGIAIVRIADADAAPPKAWFQDRRVLVTQHDQSWVALVGLPLSLEPGNHALRVKAATAGASRETTQTFTVRAKDYPEQRLIIKDRRKVTPNARDMERIRREQRIIGAAKNRWQDLSEVDPSLEIPVQGPLSSRFGLRRYFNGEARNPHAGLDLAVPSGTPIAAAGAGTVVATGDYFFNGNTVFVDHGQGLLTMYCHLERIDVRDGEAVERGQRLGLSGMSGRATGPHLHWSVIMNGAMVDPELFIGATR